MKTKMSKNLPDKETILEQLNWRYAVKKFDSEKKVSAENWLALEKAMRLAPSSYGLQPYKIFVITDEEIRAKLAPAAFNQPQITDSSHLVVFAAKKEMEDEYVDEYVDLIEKARGSVGRMSDDYVKKIKVAMQGKNESGSALSWAQRQAYISLGFLLMTAALLGIDACPMEGFSPERFDEILGLEDYATTVICAIGYRGEGDWLEDLEKVRTPREKLFVKF